MAYTGEQKKEYQKVWTAARRSEFFDGKSCVSCGSTSDLELDHIDPRLKKYQPGALWNLARDNPRRIEELAKCQVLCSECHKAKTKKWLNKNRKHGRTMYAHGCRCKTCYDAQVEHNKQRNVTVV